MYCFCGAFLSFLELGVSTFEIHGRKKEMRVSKLQMNNFRLNYSFRESQLSVCWSPVLLHMVAMSHDAQVNPALRSLNRCPSDRGPAVMTSTPIYIS